MTANSIEPTVKQGATIYYKSVPFAFLW